MPQLGTGKAPVVGTARVLWPQPLCNINPNSSGRSTGRNPPRTKGTTPNKLS